MLEHKIKMRNASLFHSTPSIGHDFEGAGEVKSGPLWLGHWENFFFSDKEISAL